MSIKLLQVTIGAAATQVSATSVPVRSVTFQNNAAHSCRVGDSTVTSSKGILIAQGTPGGSNFTGTGNQYNTDLNEWWIAGTQNDVIDILIVQ